MKFAAIDIGSNAVRLLIAEVDNDIYPVKLKKHTLLRIPLRLGEDVFDKGLITQEKIEKLTWTIQSFFYLSKVHEVVALRACATSAMREAKNGKKVIEEIRKKVGVEIEIISGSVEAEIIHSFQKAEWMSSKEISYMYVDVGGGSTELSWIEKGKIKDAISFPIGTVRMLKNKVSDKSWNDLTDWLDDKVTKTRTFEIIGSGGNINKVIKLVNTKREDDFISMVKLQKLYKELAPLTFEQRMTRYDLNSDRADVIVPALKIFTHIAVRLQAKKVLVPRIGLADGLVQRMYEAYVKKYQRIHRLS